MGSPRIWVSRWGRASQRLGAVVSVGILALAVVWFADGRWLLGSLYLLAALVNAYEARSRIYELEIDDDALIWRTPCRSGAVGFEELRDVRRAPFRYMLTIDLRDGHRLRIWDIRWFDTPRVEEWLDAWGLVPRG